MVGLQHRHAVLHPDAEAVLPGIAEGMAEIVAGAIDHHQMAFFTVKWNALGLYQPAQGQRRAEMARAKRKTKSGENFAKILAKS